MTMLPVERLYNSAWALHGQFEDILASYPKKKKEAYKIARAKKESSVDTTDILKRDMQWFVDMSRKSLEDAFKVASQESYNYSQLARVMDGLLCGILTWVEEENCSRKLSKVMNNLLADYAERLNVFRARLK